MVAGSTTTMPKPLDVRPNPPPMAVPDTVNEGTNITIGPDEIRDFLDSMEAERMGPSAEVLVELAKRFPPPQEWWDENFEEL
jgi:hypothetical protein